MLFVCRGAFLRCRHGRGAAGAAIEAGAHADVFMDHGAINESVVHDRGVYVDDRGVVREMPAAPFTTHKTHAVVTESVIHAAIETDVRSPVTGMPAVNAATKPQYPGVQRRPTRGGATQTPGTQ